MRLAEMKSTTLTSSMNDTFNPITRPFSAGYELVENAEIHTYADSEAMMDFEMFDSLTRQFGKSFVGYVDGLHYQFKRERTLPSGAIAVPADNHSDPKALLIQR
jgi:hypothetical protein